MILANTNLKGDEKSNRFQVMRYLIESVNVQGVMGVRKKVTL
jgi:hypothetical protein